MLALPHIPGTLNGLAGLWDLDGTTCPPHGRSKVPNTVPQAAKEGLRTLCLLGLTSIFITGMPICISKTLVEQMGIEHYVIGAEYGSYMLTSSGHEYYTVTPGELRAMEVFRRQSEDLVSALGAIVDDRDVRTQMNLFWDLESSYMLARAKWGSVLAEKPALQALFQKTPNGRPAPLRWQFNDNDYSMNILPAGAGKERGVGWVYEQGMRILCAAGDTKSDRPLLWAALWPIVTRTRIFAPADDTLVQVVQHHGRGSVAAEDRPDGHGLADALHQLLRELLQGSILTASSTFAETAQGG